MDDLTGVRLAALRLPPRGLRCAVCGRVHGVGRLVFWPALLLAAALMLPFGGDVQAGAGGGRAAAVRRARPAASTLPPAAVPADLESPPDPEPVAAPTALAVPATAVVWNRAGTGVYLWDRPGGAIVASIENGRIVQLADRWEALGGAPFGEVEFEGETGWVDMRSVHRVAVPEGGFDRIAAGTFLYDAPGGRALAWLPAGTPVMVTGVEEPGWQEVELVIGGETGWIVPGGLEMPLREP
ncbi:MAG TPA: SH3 domain-containing protein [Anaerolineales bacterium]|nr:SH3 domain-containing protein [Anaerolineales bacterium]